jgi:hypothetical protein
MSHVAYGHLHSGLSVYRLVYFEDCMKDTSLDFCESTFCLITYDFACCVLPLEGARTKYPGYTRPFLF